MREAPTMVPNRDEATTIYRNVERLFAACYATFRSSSFQVRSQEVKLGFQVLGAADVRKVIVVSHAD